MTRLLHIQKVTGVAGSERHLLTLLPRLDRRRFDVRFLMLVEPGQPVNQFHEALSSVGVPAVRVTIRRDLDPFCFWDVFRFIRRIGFDIVHTHLIHADLYGTLAARLAGVPTVVTTKHGYGDYANTSRLYRLNGLFRRWIAGVITSSDALQLLVEQTEGLPRSKMTTIHYGLEPARSERVSGEGVRQRLVIDERAFLILSVGRLVPVKGFSYLIEAVSLLAARGSNAVVVIVGDGPERPALEQQIEAASLGPRIRLAGWRDDVAALLAAADLFVLPSLGEGFGLAVLEAMAQARPVVATAVVAIPEIVEHGRTGLLVPPRDPQAMASSIAVLERHPRWRRRFGEAGCARARADFSTQAMVAKTERFYDDVRNGASSAGSVRQLANIGAEEKAAETRRREVSRA